MDGSYSKDNPALFTVHLLSGMRSTTPAPQWPGLHCGLLRMQMICVIMMRMTVMLMSISRLVGGDLLWLGSNRQCCWTLDNPLLWHHVTLGADYLLFLFASLSVFLYADSSLSQRFREPFTGDSHSGSAPPPSCAHSHFCPFPFTLSLLYIWVLCLSSTYLSTLLHLHPSPLNLSHSSPLILVLLPHGVIARSQASILWL